MAAELFLPSVIESAKATYGPLFEIVGEMHDLLHHDVLPSLRPLANEVFAAVTSWHHAHPNLHLFDTATQIRDLVHGEQDAWLRTLSVEVLSSLRELRTSHPEDGLADKVEQAAQIYHLAHGRTEEQIHRVVCQLSQHLSQTPSDEHIPAVDDALEQVVALLHGKPMLPLMKLLEEFKEITSQIRAQTVPLDNHMTELACQFHQEVAEPASTHLVQVYELWQTTSLEASSALLQVLETYNNTLSEGRLPPGEHQPPLAEVVKTWDERSKKRALETLGAMDQTRHFMTQASLSPQSKECLIKLAQHTAQRWVITQKSVPVLMALANQYDALVVGTDSLPRLSVLAGRLVELLRPPSPLSSPQLPAPDEEEEDPRPTAQAWRMFMDHLHEIRKQEMEEKAAQLDTPLFHLAVQLRDLVDGNPSSRLRVLTSELEESITRMKERQGGNELPAVGELVMQLRALADGDPLPRVRRLSSVLLAELNHHDLALLEEENLRELSDMLTPHLLSSACQLSALANAQIDGHLLQLSDSLQKQIAPLIHDKPSDDSDLVVLLTCVPRLAENGAYELVLQIVHLALEVLNSKLYPASGYFRDVYNQGNLLLMLGLDWWRDILPHVDQETQLLPLAQVHWFYQQVTQRDLIPLTENEWRLLSLQGYHICEQGENSRTAWNERFRQRKEHLAAFLKHALELEEPIRCDL